MNGDTDRRQRGPHPDGGRDGPERLPGGGLLVGRPFGIPVYVTPTWFLIAGIITVLLGPQIGSSFPELGRWQYVVAFAFAVLLYLSVLVHELSHSVVALRFGLPVRRISIQFLGGVSEIEQEPQTPGREFLVAAAGPALSLALAGMGYALSRVLDPQSLAGIVVSGLMWANLLVAMFNLLPGLPLDGGRMLRAAVWRVTGKPFTATLAAAWVGRVIAILLLFSPLLLAYVLGREPQLLDLIWIALLSSFIWLGAVRSVQVARLRQRIPALHVRDLARRAIPVPADLPVAEAVRRAREAGATGLVVVSSDDKPTALVSEAAVSATPEHRRPWIQVGTLAKTVVPGLVLSAELSGEALLAALRAAPATEYLVIEPTGEVFGVLAASDVKRAVVAGL